jgi:23S rRNA pseudouridine2605 synthase
MEERVQKILSRAGYGSRRACEELIAAKRVKVNDKPVILGSKADIAHDHITVDGKTLPKIEETKVYVAINKPKGVLSDMDPQEMRKTVRDLVPIPGHLFAVGRLDMDSEGLILLTNDGELANHLTHPRYEHEKEYDVQVVARPDEEQLAIWRRGVVLEDGHRTAPAKVKIESSNANGAWLRIIMHEGRKRQIREVGKRIGLPVQRIIRVRISSLLLGDLKPGEWRYLTETEIKRLQTQSKEHEGTGLTLKRTGPPRRQITDRSRPKGGKSGSV